MKEEELLNLIRMVADMAARYALLMNAGLSPNVIAEVNRQRFPELVGQSATAKQATDLLKLVLDSSTAAVVDLQHVLRDETK
jgi:hypothetical protein